MNSPAPDPMIIANLIAARSATQPDLDVLERNVAPVERECTDGARDRKRSVARVFEIEAA